MALLGECLEEFAVRPYPSFRRSVQFALALLLEAPAFAMKQPLL